MAELTRRAEQRETRDALVAQSALSSRLFPRPKKRLNRQRDRWYAKAAQLRPAGQRGGKGR